VAGRAVLYLESPNRLTGKIIERRVVEAIADEVRRGDSLVIWDASLAGWLTEGTDYVLIGSLTGIDDRAVTIGALWSGAGIEGSLLAYLAGPPSILAQARSLKQIIAICTTAPVQWGVLGALAGGAERQRLKRDVLLTCRAEAAHQATAIVLPGEAASIIAVRTPQGKVDLAQLRARPMLGAPFGAPDVLRFTVTPTGEVVGALKALAALISLPRRGDA
jgi:aspartate/methionine/tyrosine aminotransferase